MVSSGLVEVAVKVPVCGVQVSVPTVNGAPPDSTRFVPPMVISGSCPTTSVSMENVYCCPTIRFCNCCWIPPFGEAEPNPLKSTKNVPFDALWASTVGVFPQAIEFVVPGDTVQPAIAVDAAGRVM